MSDLERRLRDVVAERSHGFEPSPDLPGRIVARVEGRRRTRRLVAGAAVAAAAAALVTVVSMSGGFASREGSQWSTDGRPPASTTASSTTLPTTLPTTVPEAIGPMTPLSRSGIGPITAGMTLRAAQDAAGTSITPLGPSSNGCIDAQLGGDELAVVLMVEPPADPEADPLDGVVRAVSGSMVPSEDGAMVGQRRAELIASLGPPTSTIDMSSVYGPESEVLVFEAGGFAYGALVSADTVIGLQSGDPAWVDDPDGCAT
jgi:hypothetical protein